MRGVGSIAASSATASAMCRKILELMCKEKGAVGSTLYARIENLVAIGALTKDLGDCAHTIRGLGNEAVHDDEPIEVDVANEIYEFTRVIAEILFSYPERITRLRQATGG